MEINISNDWSSLTGLIAVIVGGFGMGLTAWNVFWQNSRENRHKDADLIRKRADNIAEITGNFVASCESANTASGAEAIARDLVSDADDQESVDTITDLQGEHMHRMHRNLEQVDIEFAKLRLALIMKNQDEKQLYQYCKAMNYELRKLVEGRCEDTECVIKYYDNQKEAVFVAAEKVLSSLRKPVSN